ncbi:MAG: hypothetical protein A3B47_04185 [Candidatus Levybacteria bacterium RIFCSPLOWO2_01_FULL_39_24]|nr:MAG: hypothetical protein A2800_04625 [Candidatus Levybacteria bacterium RIFCSPHIGHO2_01_FULL_40_16]OGH27754.1 MAG: hypothetical protein A3E12_00760 [Candidatus Levybacteria bacterium RIFCSPHIGHO2_12_FULL_39_9]OGH45870.1 MAG: hypothetical protein A3B47_04185 [Candidatus Levybacteria bacterium RIFCSPLOWO2_01_FULL_39_24]
MATQESPQMRDPAEAGEKMLPKEPLDLPAGRQGLPKEPLELNKPQAHQNTVETILEWSAPGRPFRKRSKQYYLTGLLIMLLIEVILFLFSQYMLMLVVLSLLFVAFALASIAPSDFKYRISSEGVTVEDHFFLWQELYDFYFKKKEGVDVVHIRTHSFIPGELTLTLGNIDREHIKSALLSYLPYREVIRQNFMEKSGLWLEKNFPLEKTTS